MITFSLCVLVLRPSNFFGTAGSGVGGGGNIYICIIYITHPPSRLSHSCGGLIAGRHPVYLIEQNSMSKHDASGTLSHFHLKLDHHVLFRACVISAKSRANCAILFNNTMFRYCTYYYFLNASPFPLLIDDLLCICMYVCMYTILYTSALPPPHVYMSTPSNYLCFANLTYLIL